MRLDVATVICKRVRTTKKIPQWVRVTRICGVVTALFMSSASVFSVWNALAQGVSWQSCLPILLRPGAALILLLLLPWRRIRYASLYACLVVAYVFCVAVAIPRAVVGVRDTILNCHPDYPPPALAFVLSVTATVAILVAQIPALWVIRSKIKGDVADAVETCLEADRKG